MPSSLLELEKERRGGGARLTNPPRTLLDLLLFRVFFEKILPTIHLEEAFCAETRVKFHREAALSDTN